MLYESRQPQLSAPLSVVICCYTEKRLDLLKASVNSVVTQMREAPAGHGELIIVVDNNPGFAAVLRDCLTQTAQGLTVVEHTGARGLSGARNHGLQCCRHNIVIFLDDDAVLAEGSLQAVARTFGGARRIQTSALAGSVLPRWECGDAPRWFPAEFGWVVGCDYVGMPADGSVVRNPIGACMAVRRDLLLCAGGFSADLGRVGRLPVGCEETLMGIRFRELYPGLRVERFAALLAHHYVPLERQQVSYFLSRCFHEGRSKAVLSDLSSRSAALETEFAFATRVLPRGMIRGILSGARGDLFGFVRAVVIVLGFVTTASGFAAAKISHYTNIRALRSGYAGSLLNLP